MFLINFMYQWFNNIKKNIKRESIFFFLRFLILMILKLLKHRLKVVCTIFGNQNIETLQSQAIYTFWFYLQLEIEKVILFWRKAKQGKTMSLQKTWLFTTAMNWATNFQFLHSLTHPTYHQSNDLDDVHVNEY